MINNTDPIGRNPSQLPIPGISNQSDEVDLLDLEETETVSNQETSGLDKILSSELIIGNSESVATVLTFYRMEKPNPDSNPNERNAIY